MIFDSHAHYNDERFSPDRDELLDSMQNKSVGMIMNSCSSLEEIPEIIKIIEKYPFIYGSVGVHPHEVEFMKESDIDVLEEYSKHPKIKAIGEIGLDYYYDNSPRDLQKLWFAHQIDLAVRLDLPIVIHDRDAHKDTLDILTKHNAKAVGGDFHCYTGSPEMLKQILDMNFFVAFGGSVTFKNAVRPQEACKATPLERLLIETDCPYLTPVPHRGERNDSSYLVFVAEKIAELKGIDSETVINASFENAKKCFRIN